MANSVRQFPFSEEKCGRVVLPGLVKVIRLVDMQETCIEKEIYLTGDRMNLLRGEESETYESHQQREGRRRL